MAEMIQIVIEETPMIVGATKESKTRIEHTVNNTVLVNETLLLFINFFPFFIYYFGCC